MVKKHNSPFLYSDGFKRYHTLDYHFRQKYSQKVCKVLLSSGMSCPNRDGTKGVGGCTFCSGAGGGEFSPASGISLAEQYARGAEALRNKWGEVGFIGYLQAFSNTHAPVEILEPLLRQATALPAILELRIATRADCLDADKIALLQEVSKRLPISLELGLQSIHDETAARINRCHSFAEFLDGYVRAKDAGLAVCVHLINGLPGESRAMMLQTAKVVGRLRPDGVKFHMLHLIKGTALHREYEAHPFALLSREEYVATLCEQLLYLPAATVIERLTGDADRKTLVAPGWTRNKLQVLNDIDRRLYERNEFQGMLFTE